MSSVNQEALTSHRVKAHDVTAFAASSFQSGVSLEQFFFQAAIGSHTTPSYNSILRM